MDAAASYTPATRALDGKGNCRGKRPRPLADLRREDSLRDRTNSPRSQRDQTEQELTAGAAFSAAGGSALGASTLPRPGTRPRPKGEQQPAPDGREAAELGLESPAERRSTIFSSAGWTPRLSVESGIYILFIAIAIFTRFWDLGSRALHHDESLHAYYSWVYETGGDYQHHPLMHGPFLFHMNALVFALFGDSDATARYSVAFFGVILVALPFFLRGSRFLGRWGALTASALLLISPSLFYMSRCVRHDIYTIVG